ncbi:hypothetical protein AQUCO_08800008v1 [Aquilegia coerulea]|uniref:TF-B3 domain-containing protein n=1 Tax=Aquilegia coerulea TaxID=218851 RepID=A0A2G5C6A3_AQUCA|nr:hypothetical protein AQUCO_08800008v1 [Aquilegia coerulea]
MKELADLKKDKETIGAARVPYATYEIGLFGMKVGLAPETTTNTTRVITTSVAATASQTEEDGDYKLTKREKRALEAAPGFKSNYPWFAVPIVKSHKHQLILPFKFVKQHLPKESMNARIVDSFERTWTVWYKYKKGRSLLYTGWNSFWLGNELKEGDVCAFELIDKEKIKLRVSIRKK